jgi:hypothetical protein
MDRLGVRKGTAGNTKTPPTPRVAALVGRAVDPTSNIGGSTDKRVSADETPVPGDIGGALHS